MDNIIISNETVIRLGVFFSVLLVIAGLEVLFPRRQLKLSKGLRWRNNLALVVLDAIVLRLLFPAALVGFTLFANNNGWGLFNYFQVPLLIAAIVSVIILDLVIYLQHVMVHAVPLFWRVHRVHHADLDYDVTTGTRFHPFEIILSMLIKFAAVCVLGPPVVAVILFEVLLNASAMFNHGNLRLPPGLDKILRLIIVTPDMHRVHHSVYDDETNSNFGSNFSLWDRLFGTYKAQPRDGHEGMQIGLRGFQKQDQVAKLPGLLILPFVGKISGYAINRRECERESSEDRR